jgi:hypothetical protein
MEAGCCGEDCSGMFGRPATRWTEVLGNFLIFNGSRRYLPDNQRNQVFDQEVYKRIYLHGDSLFGRFARQVPVTKI